MRGLVVLGILCVFGFANLAQADTAVVEFNLNSNPQVETPTTEVAEMELVEGRIGIIQRRRMGLTLGNLIAVAREAKAQGRLDNAETHADMTAVLLQGLVASNPQQFANVSGPDWDAIFEFIERLIPLIMLLIGLF